MKRLCAMAGRPSPRRAAFTLIEILVVVAIVALLASLTIGVSRNVIARSKEYDTGLMLQAVRNKVIQYKDTFGDYPVCSSSQLVDRLENLANTDMKAILGDRYVDGGQIVDSWKKPIRYYYSSGSPISSGISYYDDYYRKKNYTPLLISAGPDMEFGPTTVEGAVGTRDNFDDIINPPE